MHAHSPYTARPHMTARTMELNLSSRITMSDASLATCTGWKAAAKSTEATQQQSTTEWRPRTQCRQEGRRLPASTGGNTHLCACDTHGQSYVCRLQRRSIVGAVTSNTHHGTAKLGARTLHGGNMETCSGADAERRKAPCSLAVRVVRAHTSGCPTLLRRASHSSMYPGMTASWMESWPTISDGFLPSPSALYRAAAVPQVYSLLRCSSSHSPEVRGRLPFCGQWTQTRKVHDGQG
jgi:hypothetical protein